MNEKCRPNMTGDLESVCETHWRTIDTSLKIMEQSAEAMRRTSDTVSAVHGYRVYLLDRDGRVEAAESFAASTADDATAIANAVYLSSSDVFSGHEVWAGKQRISSAEGSVSADPEKRRALERAIQRHQDIIIDLEERLQIAFGCVNRSRNLRDTVALTRDRMANPLSRLTPRPNCP
jgi:hypothetical protein